MFRHAWLVVAVSSLASAQTERFGFGYDNTGNMTTLKNVTYDSANCGDVGASCAAGVQCCGAQCCNAPSRCTSNYECCTPQTCTWQRCGTINDQCGQTLTCGAVCAASTSCVSNGCYQDSGRGYVVDGSNASNEFIIRAGTRDVEIRGQFVSSRAGYTSAMRFLGQTPTNSTVCPRIATLDGGVVDRCPIYTGDCTSCAADPNALPGEISCWCTRGQRIEYPLLTATKSITFGSNLFVDQNRDGRSEELRCNTQGAGAQRLSPVRYYPIVSTPTNPLAGPRYQASLIRFEWEDNETPPNGDFNDYVGALSVKDCDGTRYPPEIQGDIEYPLECQSECSATTCPPGDGQPVDLRFAVAVGTDRTSGENIGTRESARKITVSVAVYSDDGGTSSGDNFAVCPVIWFGYGTSSGKLPWACTTGAPDPIFDHSVGATKVCKFSPTPTNAIACGQNATKPCDKFPIALAREQVYRATCPVTARTGPTDSFKLPLGSNCGATPTLLNYELKTDEIDAALTPSNNVPFAPLPLIGRQSIDILGINAVPRNRARLAVQSVDLYVISGLSNTKDFRFPSGVNVNIQGFAQNLLNAGKVVRKRTFSHPEFGQTQLRFSVYERF